jgi:hypothetical protein
MFKERVLKKDPWHGGDASSMWMKMSTCIRKVTSEEFGVIKGGKRETKETWWWNEKVQRRENPLCALESYGNPRFAPGKVVISSMPLLQNFTPFRATTVSIRPNVR